MEGEKIQGKIIVAREGERERKFQGVVGGGEEAAGGCVGQRSGAPGQAGERYSCQG